MPTEIPHEEPADPSALEYEALPQPTRDRPGISRGVWVVLAGFCGFAVAAELVATNGRLRVDDVPFAVALTAVGVIAVVAALRRRR
jgi:hypothetical protein